MGSPQALHGYLLERLSWILRKLIRILWPINTLTEMASQFTGDGAGRDHEGYYWIRGRVDDVVNVSGHRLSTAEIEAALIEHRMLHLR